MTAPYRTTMRKSEVIGVVEHMTRVQRPVTPGELGAVWGLSLTSSDELLARAVEDGYVYKLNVAAVRNYGRHPDTLLYDKGPQWDLLLQQYNEYKKELKK